MREAPHQVSSTTAWKRANRDRINADRRAAYEADGGAAHRAREKAREVRSPLMVQASRMMQNLRHARTEGIFVDPKITRSMCMLWLSASPTCPCCNVEFVIGHSGDGRFNDASPSLDRFIPERGYAIGNLTVICWRCNNIKRNYSAADLRGVADWIERRSRVSMSGPVEAAAAD